jgi:hypothetical protein
MSDAKNDAHEAGGKLKREEHERELARLHRLQGCRYLARDGARSRSTASGDPEAVGNEPFYRDLRILLVGVFAQIVASRRHRCASTRCVSHSVEGSCARS